MIQMKSKITIFIYVALLRSIIYGEKTLLECEEDVRKIAKAEDQIEGIFQPLGDASLGMGSFGFAYRGILLPIKEKIAMKFTSPGNFREAEQEYQMYSYLEAINNSDIERYGIPVVYYYGLWNENNFTMMGITLLDENLDDLAMSKRLFENDVNTLIIIRDFILSSKYMHSHAVRHDDIKIKNMMVRKHRTFLFDFNVSSRMNERSRAGTKNYLSRRGHNNGERYPKDDWESFFYSICTALGIKFPWTKRKSSSEIFMLKSNTTNTIKQIETINSETLRNVLVQFAEHTFDEGEGVESNEEVFYDADAIEQISDESKQREKGICFDVNNKNRFPDYDRFYKLVNNEIKKSNLTKPVMFTWLTPEHKAEAIKDLEKYPIPDITKIAEPKDYDYSAIKYPNIDAHQFMRAYKDWKASSSQTFVSAEPSLS